jgi:IS5 family transposase
MSRLLDANQVALKAVHADLLRIRKADAKQGREGMSAEQVVRAAIIKQMLGLSYDELAFQLGDSLQLRAFCRLSSADDAPAKSTLQANIGAIRAGDVGGNEQVAFEGGTQMQGRGRALDADGHDSDRVQYPPPARFAIALGRRASPHEDHAASP